MQESLEIIELGNPLLRQKSKCVENFEDAAIIRLIDDLLTTVKISNGVGIAAPQVGQLWQLLIIASHPNKRYPNAPKMKPTPIINPRIMAFEGKKAKDWEGCLSIPGIRGKVPRYPTVHIEYQDRTGRVQKTVLTDFIARIFQHEYDHLEGRVYLDHVELAQDIMTEKEYQKQIVGQ